jgi:prepilin-type processing-associated H-X9-DG protein
MATHLYPCFFLRTANPYNVLNLRELGSHASDIVLQSDLGNAQRTGPHNHGLNILYFDGHVETEFQNKPKHGLWEILENPPRIGYKRYRKVSDPWWPW